MGLGNFKPKFYLLSAIFVTAIVIALIFNLSSPKKEVILASQQVLGTHTPRLNSDFLQPIKIIDDANEWRGKSKETEPEEIIFDVGAPLYPEDVVKCFPDPKLKIGTTIEINRAPVVYLNDGGIKKELRSWVKTVEDLLKEKKIELGDLDKLSVPENKKIKNGMKITITRVGEREEEEAIIIPFKTREIADKSMYKGETKLKQSGRNGKRVKRYRLVYENNKLVSQDLISDEIIEQPKSKIIAYGTRSKITVRCRFNDIVEDAAAKYGLNPNDLCRTMMCESNGNPYSVGGGGAYKGLFQYSSGFWALISPRAGFSGASIWDARAQIYVTAWAWSHGHRGRWPRC